MITLPPTCRTEGLMHMRGALIEIDCNHWHIVDARLRHQDGSIVMRLMRPTQRFEQCGQCDHCSPCYAYDVYRMRRLLRPCGPTKTHEIIVQADQIWEQDYKGVFHMCESSKRWKLMVNGASLVGGEWTSLASAEARARELVCNGTYNDVVTLETISTTKRADITCTRHT